DHDLLREVVLAEQEDASMQQTRHGSLADAKRRRAASREAGGRGDRSLLPEVAYHYLEAGQWLEAARSHKEAGDAARDSLAFRDAAGFYGTAARLLTERPDLPLNADERAGLD